LRGIQGFPQDPGARGPKPGDSLLNARPLEPFQHLEGQLQGLAANDPFWEKISPQPDHFAIAADWENSIFFDLGD
jgi:hypothetical protein